MTTTVMCGICGTRNQAAMGHCRRCKAPLSGRSIGASETVRGTPTSALIDERWAMVGQAPQMGPRWWQGKDVATGQPVLIYEVAGAAGGDEAVQWLDLARRRQDIDHRGLLAVVAVSATERGVVMIMSHRAGASLAKNLDERAGFPLPVALHFLEALVEGVEILHDHGLVHGELGPDTIWIDQEGPVGLPAAVVAGGVKPRKPQSVAADYRGLARALGAILLGRDYEASMTAGVVIGSAIERLRWQIGSDVVPRVQKLFDILVRADSTAPKRRREEISDAIGRLGDGVDWSMMPVPRGPFVRGSKAEDREARPEEKPSAMVDVGAFFMDHTPVTAGDFARFIEATGHVMPDAWDDYNDPAAAPELPVVYVNWDDACAYARWAGKRLPREAEWEKAARGTDGRTYPWGDEPPEERFAWYGTKPGPEPVGRRRLGQSIYGVCDMAGNVFEWVADWFDPEYYAQAPPSGPTGPATGTHRVLRGGSYAHSPFALRCASRGRYDPRARRANHSFRCVWSLHA